MAKPIQEHIGQRAIEAFVEFARADIEEPATLEQTTYGHIADARLRRALAQVHYGARWIYKLGLVTLARNEERAAHVRAQIVDYASLCEALVSYCNGIALDRGHAIGTAHHWTNPDELVPAKRRPIRWGKASTETVLRKQGFWWQARIAWEFKIITKDHFEDLDWLRSERNSVHVRQRVAIGATAYLGESAKAFAVLCECVRQSTVWKAGHP